MKPALFFRGCFSLVFLLLSLPLAGQVRAGAIEMERLDSVLRFSSGGKVICEYQMEAGGLPSGTPSIFAHGAHLHPVYSPSGRAVTGNYPEDHPWHRGIWMAWTKTEFGASQPDFWNQGKGGGKDKESTRLLAEVRFSELVKSWGGPGEGGFVSRHQFLDHSTAPDEKVLDETWEVTVSQETADGIPVNVIDLLSTQTCAGEKALKLPQFHYGGLGVRGNLLWNPVDAVTLLTSEGHNRENGDSTRAKWVHIGGIVDGEPTGMAILIHPDNFRFPQPLRLNPKNPQLSIAPSQEGDWSIEPGQPFLSRYRFLVFDGEPEAKWIDAQWERYSRSEPSATQVP